MAPQPAGEAGARGKSGGDGGDVQNYDAAKAKAKSKNLRRMNVPEREAVRKQVAMFQHLPQYQRSTSLTKEIGFGAGTGTIHPAVIRLGLKMSEGIVTGSTARSG